MYCPSCGGENAIGLPYCNRCGANLSTSLTATPEPVQINVTKPILIIGGIIALLTLGGFGMLISGAIELSRTPNMGSDPVIAMVFVGMIAIMATDFFLVRLLSKLISAALSAPGVKPQFNRQVGVTHAPAQLPQANTAPFQQAPSVTENTTRFFEPVYRAPAEAQAVPPPKNPEK